MKILKNILTGLTFLFLFSLLTRNLGSYRKKLAFYQQIKNNYQQEKKKNTRFKTEILRSQGKANLEKKIRNKLDLLKENEVALIIPRITPAPTIVVPPPLANWQRWLKIFNLD